MKKDKSIFALLVGIDLYPSGISQLQGCVNDISAIKHLLEANFSSFNLQVLKLENESATRANIINGFRQHLSKANKNDTILFYYSGHGSIETAPNAFWSSSPNRKNETLVCYDSRTPEGLDLADKELAVLLNEVTTKTDHIVVCLDCCHAGSGTRDTIRLTAVRQVTKEGNTRSLESYIDGYYSQQLEQTGRVIVPTPSHVLLAACQNSEKAYETHEHHGVFTTALLASLNNAQQGGITYSELYAKIALQVRNQQDSQHPNFEFFNKFNPHTLFLTVFVYFLLFLMKKQQNGKLGRVLYMGFP